MIKGKQAIKMWDDLEGWYFHTMVPHADYGRTISKQGRVVEILSDNEVRVIYGSWMTAETNGEDVLTKADMRDCRFYPTSDEMNAFAQAEDEREEQIDLRLQNVAIA